MMCLRDYFCLHDAKPKWVIWGEKNKPVHVCIYPSNFLFFIWFYPCSVSVLGSFNLYLCYVSFLIGLISFYAYSILKLTWNLWLKWRGDPIYPITILDYIQTRSDNIVAAEWRSIRGGRGGGAVCNWINKIQLLLPVSACEMTKFCAVPLHSSFQPLLPHHPSVH